MKRYFFAGCCLIFYQQQIISQLIASETFNYPPGSIVGQNGGTGWGTPWQTTSFNLANTTIVTPGLSSTQVAGTGNANHQVGNDFRNFRMIDTTNAAFFSYMDYNGDPGAGPGINYQFGRAFGKDNTTIWFGVLMRKTSAPATKGYGGLHLMYGYDLNYDQYGNKMAHQRFQFGTDNNSNNQYIISRTINGNPNLPGCANTVYSGVAASSLTDFLLYRIDFKPGPETVYLWVNPPPGCTPPAIAIANVTTTVCDFRFNAVNIGAGSSSGTVQYDVDEFRVGLSYADVVTCSLLPLRFTSFTATTNDNSCITEWKTAEDDEVIKYEVQKAKDGISFYTVGSVDRNNFHAYTFEDILADRATYYRIRAILVNNEFLFSGIIACKKIQATQSFAYPNPFTNVITIVSAGKFQHVKILNEEGNVLISRTVSTGQKNIVFDLSMFVSGIYTAELFDGNQFSYLKLVKK